MCSGVAKMRLRLLLGNDYSEESQWSHRFNFMGELMFGFIFLIAAFFIYVVRRQPPRPKCIFRPLMTYLA